MALRKAGDEPSCSFCKKSKSIVGNLVSSPIEYPRAYICDECISVCHSILEDEEGKQEDLFIGNPLLSEFLAVAEQWAAAEQAGHDDSEHLLRLRQIARLMFPAPPDS